MAVVSDQTRMVDLAFKKLISKQYSDPTKPYYNESSIAPFTLGANNVWVEEIPENPLDAITKPNLDGHPIAEGVVKRRTNPNTKQEEEYAEGMTYVLTKDESTKSPYAYYIYENENDKDANGNIISPRYTGFISDLYGQAYGAALFKENGEEILTGVNGWLFDYATGTLTLTDPIPGKLKIKAYRYIGRTVKEAVGETFDEDLGNLIIQPNKKINLKADIKAYNDAHGITS